MGGFRFWLKGVMAAALLALASVLSWTTVSKTTSAPPGNITGFVAGETGRVVRVLDGDSLVLDTGLRIVLAGIQAPKPARTDSKNNSTPWPLAGAATQALAQLVQGKTVRLYYGGTRRDRYGRALAQVYLVGENGAPDIWVQQTMVSAGLARVYSWAGQYQNIRVLYTAEQKARDAGRGIWDSQANGGFYDIRKPDPNPLVQYVDSVQIVEGFIIKTAEVRGTIYLNFGADYKTDFTIAIAKKARKNFKHADYDPLTLQGARVRVRGYVEIYGGPIIWLDDPKRLEILD